MDVIDAYIDARNATDPTERRTLPERVWTEDGRYTDPLAVAPDGRVRAVHGFVDNVPG